MKKITLMFFMALFSLSAFAQLPLESFEGSFPPTGWGIYDNGIGTNQSWMQSNNTAAQPAHTGTYAAYVNRENVPTGLPEDWLVTPQFPVPTNAQVKFWSRLTQGGDQGTLYQVRVSTNAAQAALGNYTVVKQWTENEINPTQLEYVPVTVDIPTNVAAVGSQAYVAFVMLGDNADRWLIDDVQVVSKCLDPTGLTSSNLGLTTATLSWNANGATAWEIEIVPASGAPTGNWTPVPGTSPTYNATNLLPDTDYKYYVRAICGPGNTSTTVGPSAFGTVAPGATCQAPKVIAGLPYATTDNTSNYGDDVEGTPGNTGCGTTGTFLNGDEVFYSYTATFTGTVSINMTGNGANSGMFVYTSCANVGSSCAAGGVGNATTPVSIPSFSVTSGQTYFIVISTSGTTQSTPYTLVIQQVNCAQPVGQTTTNINDNSATLNWSNPSSATSWEVVVQPVGTGLPTGAGTTVNTNPIYIATNLSQATTYEYYVRANCGNGTFSAWAGPYTFTTTQIPTTLNYSEGFEGVSGWSFINGTQANKWIVGTATANGGTHSMYITNDNGATNSYNVSSGSVVQAYRDIQLPATVNQVSLQFDWKGQGESTFDYLRVWVVPSTFLPTAGTQITASADRVQLGGNLNQNGTWTTANYTINAAAYAGQIRRLVFEWRNDGSLGTQPPAAVDNINLSLITCPSPSALTLGTVSVNSATFNWTASGQGTPTYDYYISTATTAPTAATTPSGNVPGTTATVGSLTPSTAYNVWVRANCGSGDTSFWIGPLSFTTPQIPATVNYNEDFEGPINWTLNNGTQTNKWVVGTATSNSPTHSLYISNDNGTSNAYDTGTTSVTQAYRDIQLPATANQMNLQFDWKAAGESTFDYLRVWMVPITFTPTPGTQITAAADRVQVGGNLNQNTNWTTATFTINAAPYAGQIRRLVFEWRNDNSVGTQPPAAVDNIFFGIITCPAPTALVLNNVSINDATFSWTATNPAPASYDYYISTSNTSPVAATVPSGNVTAPTATAAGLSPSTTYYVWVRANCGAGDTSLWVGPLTISTPQIPATLNWSDDFEGPINWTTLNGTQVNKWVVGTATSNSPTHSLYISNDNGVTNSYATGTTSVTQAYRDIQIPAGTTAQADLSFDWKAAGESSFDYLRVWVVPVTFTPTPGTQIAAGTGRTQIGGNYNQNTTWTTVTNTINLTPYAGQIIRLVFEWRNDGSGGTQPPAAVDNVSLVIPTCPKPTNLAATNITQTSADLSWTEMSDATAWEVIVVPAGSPAPTASSTGTPTTTTSYPATGLNSGTQYVFYVRADCGAADGLSRWAGPFAFSTLIANDECAGALPVTVNNNSYCNQTTAGALIGATASSQPNTCAGTADDDVWFEFTATQANHYIALLNASGNDMSNDNMVHAVYTGTCGALSLVYCSDDNKSNANGLTPGQTYKIRVYSNAATPQTFQFRVCVGVALTCADSQPFCANNTQAGVQFPGSVGVPNLGTISCLFTTPNPTYYFLQVQNPGTLALNISQVNYANTPVDVDFIAYGPFADLTAACAGLTSGNQVACSYSAAATENFTITNAPANSYYLVLITNFSEDRGTINFTQTNLSSPGAGTTNCAIVCTANLGPDQILCGTNSVVLDSNIINADSYTWSLDGQVQAVITGGAGQTYTATQSGNWTVSIVKAACQNNPTDTVNVQFLPTVDLTNPADVTLCGNNGSTQLDLTTLNASVLGSLNPANYVVEYYTTLAAANAGTSPINTATPFTTGTQTIYVRVEHTLLGTCFDVVPLNIIVNATANATISYAGSPFCSNETTGAVTLTGNSGGTYSSTTGLTIDPATGAIDVATSTPGTYTVTYDIAATASCPAFTTTTTVSIVEAPAAAISYDQTPYCSGAAQATVTQTGTTGGTYSSTAGLVIDPATGAIDLALSTPGDYVVSYTISATADCAALTVTANVTINLLPAATIAYADAPFCSNETTGTVTQTGTTGGTYSSTTGLTIDPATGAIDIATSTAGTYTVTYTIAASASCPEVTTTTSITIVDAPTATISYDQTPYCSGSAQATVTQTGTTGGTYSSTAGLVIDPATGAIDLALSTPGDYVVSYTIPATADCAALTVTANVTINLLPAATIAYADAPFCSNETTGTVTQTGTTGGTYSSTTGLTIDPATGAIDIATSTAGTYTVTYTIAASASCPEVTTTTSITIVDAPTATISYDQTPYCSGSAQATVTQTGTTGGSYSSTAGLVIDPATGAIDLALSTPGDYVVSYTIPATADCAALTVTANVTINLLPAATISYPGSPFCTNGTTAAVTFTGTTGGTYTSTAGLIIDPVTGTIDVANSTAGTYTVTYTIAASASCPEVTATANVVIEQAPSATISYTGTPYCSNEGMAMVSFTGTTGGTFSSTAGLVINAATGEVDLAASTAGTYIVSYDIAAGTACAALHEEATIEITTAAAATISYATPFCSTSGIAAVTFTGTTGGTFASSAGLTIDPATGTITPATSTPGSYTVTYTLPAVGGCDPIVATFNIVITPEPKADFTYDFGTVCQSFGTAIPTFDTGATAGTFTVTPATGLSINAATGVITTATSTPGTYVVTNTIAAAGGCGSVTDSFTITIDPAPVATFNYGAVPEYCNELTTTVSPTLNGTAGTFTVTPATGLSINTTTGAVDIAASQPGVYTVTNTLAGTPQCPSVSATATITIKATPQVDLGGPYTRCALETITVTATPVNFTGTASYAWTLAGTTIGGNTASVAVNGYGTLEVTVTVNGCTSVESVAITPSTDVVDVAFNGGCDGGSYRLSALPDMSSFDPATTTYSWSGPSGFTSTAQTITTPAAGVYTVTVTTADGCTGTESFTVDSVQCMIQKGISPGDGDKNEFFDLTGFNVTHLSIFNRYGKEVFSMNNYTNQWHGQESNGNDLPTGTYFYSIEMAGGETKTGWIYINRAQ